MDTKNKPKSDTWPHGEHDVELSINLLIEGRFEKAVEVKFTVPLPMAAHPDFANFRKEQMRTVLDMLMAKPAFYAYKLYLDRLHGKAAPPGAKTDDAKPDEPPTSEPPS
jgi:hypothetical protein